MSEPKKIAISCGDLNGIGLELLAKIFADERMFQFCTPVLYANGDIFKAHSSIDGIGNVPCKTISNLNEIEVNKVNVLQIWNEAVTIDFGEPKKDLSQYTVTSLKKATKDVIDKQLDALVTLPINKDVISNQTFNYTGHTEYLRDATGQQESLMFLVANTTMRVGLVTNHLPIKDVAKNISQSNILKKVQLMHQSLKEDFGIVKPKIALLGLNPHAGDNGLIGKEEHTTILPAINKLMRDGIIAVGPYSADGFFGMGMYKQYDGVMAMYHDQGLLPFKMLCFDEGVNFTAGLPIVRTSPDHGTAYNIAGKGFGNPESLRNAIFMAIEIVNQRQLNS